MKAAISVEHVSKQYLLGSNVANRLPRYLFPGLFKKEKAFFQALNNISFEVHRGECFGIMGINGAGKSTLLQIIAGVLQPTSGKVSVNGDVSALLELGAGFNPELTGIENIKLTGILKGMSDKKVKEVLDSVIDFADIGEFIERPVKVYSSGMFMRVAFAANLMNSPEILIVDEALAVGDLNFQKKCIQRFYELRNAGTTVLFVSHDNYQVRHVCDRALLLNQGCAVAYGDSDFIAQEYDILLDKQNAGDSQLVAQNSNVGDRIMITDIKLLNAAGEESYEYVINDELNLTATILIQNTQEFDELTFVANLYRHDDLYICGTTTLMDGFEPFETSSEMQVTMTLPKLKLLSGRYKWRFAVNEKNGLGIFTERVPICEFTVSDNFEAVGLVDLDRIWKVQRG